MGELRNKCVANHPEWWTNVTVCYYHNYIYIFNTHYFYEKKK
jgi:hypothetical protein